ncbi:unnamed protein product, partial [Amoebophrya sp. A25]
ERNPFHQPVAEIFQAGVYPRAEGEGLEIVEGTQKSLTFLEFKLLTEKLFDHVHEFEEDEDEMR